MNPASAPAEIDDSIERSQSRGECKVSPPREYITFLPFARAAGGSFDVGRVKRGEINSRRSVLKSSLYQRAGQQGKTRRVKARFNSLSLFFVVGLKECLVCRPGFNSVGCRSGNLEHKRGGILVQGGRQLARFPRFPRPSTPVSEKK